MKPTTEAYTVAMPWYEREDFPQLWALAHDRADMPTDYDEWHRKALAVVQADLVRGRALQFVTIRPAGFLAWLAENGLPNTAATRLRYVEVQATRLGDAA